jgi:hypothetical protein
MKVLLNGLLGVGLVLYGLDLQQSAIAQQTKNSGFVEIIRIGNSRPKAEPKGSIVINRDASPRGKSARHVIPFIKE